MTPDQLIAVLGAIAIPLMLAAAVALWRLATKLSTIETLVTYEMNHNGGGSTKDYAKAGRDEAVAAREESKQAKHIAENVDAKVDQLTARQTAIEKRLLQVNNVVVGMQAVQTYRESDRPPGSTTSSTTITHTNSEGTNI